MNDLAEIIKKRTTPGILLFDPEYRLLYSNNEAADLLSAACVEGPEKVAVPSRVYQYCRQLRTRSVTMADDLNYPVLEIGSVHCSVRGFLLDDHENEGYTGHVLVLMERIVKKHQVDIEKARLEFKLTKREADVVRLLCQGLGNREISEKMFISEYTAKDHIKNLMKKMKAGSRNEIIALLK